MNIGHYYQNTEGRQTFPVEAELCLLSCEGALLYCGRRSSPDGDVGVLGVVGVVGVWLPDLREEACEEAMLSRESCLLLTFCCPKTTCPFNTTGLKF